MTTLIAKTVKYVPAWVPGAGFKKKAAIWKKAVLSMRDLPFRTVQKALVSWTMDRCPPTTNYHTSQANGTASPCFVSHLMSDLDSKEDVDDEIEVIKGCAGLAYAGMSLVPRQTLA